MGKNLVKTLTIPVGVIMSYDNRSKSLTAFDDETRKNVYNLLRDCSAAYAQLVNITAARLYAIKVAGVPKAKVPKEGIPTSYAPIANRLQSLDMLSGETKSQAHQEANAFFSGEHRKDLLGIGKRQLPTAHTDGTHAVPVRSDAITLFQDQSKYWLAMKIFAPKFADKNNIPSWIAFQIQPKRRDKTMLQQLEKIGRGDWQLKNGRFMRSRKKRGKKWMVQIVVGYEAEPYKTLDEKTIMGIDLGLNKPAVLHIRDKDKSNLWTAQAGNGRSMLQSRNVVRSEIRHIVRGLRTKDSLLIGKARDEAKERLRVLRQRERNIMKTAARNIASRIAELAKRNGAGTWQMEDLSSNIKDDQPWLARNWAPGAIKDAVRWQAQQLGANLTFINPQYTSQRCSKCGFISRDNRPKDKKGQAYFKCVECGHSENADSNAARNISTPGIDKVIAKALKSKSKAVNTAEEE